MVLGIINWRMLRTVNNSSILQFEIPMLQKMNGLLLAGILLLITAPFLAGWYLQGDAFAYTGFLLNPMDGNSYLAKMQIGLRDEWRFQLPYTTAQGEGGYLFLFYIFLGHLARLAQLEPIVVFHIARIGGSVFLVFSALRFLSASIGTVDRAVCQRIFLLLSFGSGLGWLAALAGGFTMDFWVAEAYPYVSMLANPHFPLGLAILLQYLTALQQERLPNYGLLFITGALLAIILPFGVVVGTVVTVLVLGMRYLRVKKILWRLPLVFLLPAGGLLLYQYVVVLNDPLLAIWNRQNQTLSPPLWDFVISFAPAVLLAGVGFWEWMRKGRNPNLDTAAAWLVAGVVLAYFPFPLQRRFLLGLYIPIGIFAGLGLLALAGHKIRRFKRLFGALFVLSILTNVFILLGGFQAGIQHEAWLYQRRDQRAALTWLAGSACADRPVVLANPVMGLFIPAHTHCRVIYGHPFETVDAPTREEQVRRIFSGKMRLAQMQAYLDQWQVDYILLDSHTDQLETAAIARAGFAPVYQNPTLTIFKTETKP